MRPTEIELPKGIRAEYEGGATLQSLAASLGVSVTTVRHRLLLDGCKMRRKGRLAKDSSWILEQDALDRPHAEIARKVGLTRERVRQICNAHGRPPRSGRRRVMENHAKELKARREARRARMEMLSKAWKSGVSCLEFSALLGAANPKATSGGSYAAYFRKRFGEGMFPYRKPRNKQ